MYFVYFVQMPGLIVSAMNQAMNNGGPENLDATNSILFWSVCLVRLRLVINPIIFIVR